MVREHAIAKLLHDGQRLAEGRNVNQLHLVEEQIDERTLIYGTLKDVTEADTARRSRKGQVFSLEPRVN